MCLNPGDILRDRYEIIEVLGRGGFATTYKAVDLLHERGENPLCVVKEIEPPDSQDPQVLQYAQEQFAREVRTLIRLGEHDRIPRFFDGFQERTCSRERENFYLILEYIEGHALDREVTSDTDWNETQVIEFLQNILPVIEFVHHNNVIHRDIKPSNLIRRASDNQIVLIDFGSVKEISSLEITESGQTRTRIIYTPGYAAPEQMHGNPQLCSDIYSVGITAIQAITGLRPDRGDVLLHPRGYTVWHYSTPDRQIAEISRQLQTVLDKMVSYDFPDRYQSAADVLQALQAIQLPLDEPNSDTNTGNGNLPCSPTNNQTVPQAENCLQELYATTNYLTFTNVFDPSSQKLKIGISIAIAGLVWLATFLTRAIVFSPKSYPLIQGDALSGGEEILIKTSAPRLKKKGVEEFAKSNYESAFNLFKKSWNAEYSKDSETLIYMNNAFLEATKTPYYTIAMALPISNRRNPERSAYMGDRAKEFLRGVAQAQTEVNFGLSNANSNPDFPGQGFLPPSKAINGKGLKVIIADDMNDGASAQKRAISLVDRPDILAVVGHASSEMTMYSVDIYNNNNLVLMSPGAATEELTYEPRKNFFRTLYTSSAIARDLANYLLAKKQKQAVILYNPASPFGASFREEFTKYFQDKRGGKILWVRDFDLSKQDFNAQRAIEEIQGKGETAIVLAPDPHLTISLDRALEIIKLNRDRNWIVGAWTLVFPQMLEFASKQQQKLFKKLIFAVSWHPLNSPNKKFPQQVRALWGEEGNTRTASAYDATRALIKALELQPNPTRPGMQKMLASPDFSTEGATGSIQFNSPTNGDRKNPPSDLVHIVECPKEPFGLAFVPVKYPTAVAAGLKCD